MKTSVVITTWNRSNQLFKCMWSLLNAERIPEEIIVVDDGPSSDNTAETVKNYADLYRDVQISYIVNKREGAWTNPAIPRNKGIRLTNPSHELILLSEPEMLLMPDTFRKMIEFFENPPERLDSDWRTTWIPGSKTPENFFLTASYTGFAHIYEIGQGESFKDARACFGSVNDMDRRWPEINTRVALIKREDLFKIRGWDEGMIGWGTDDTSAMTRLQMIGANHIPLYLPVVHLKHEDAPADGKPADKNRDRMQAQVAAGIYAPNDENWGISRHPRYGVKQSAEQWQSVQESEIESWTTKAWPSQEGKLYRERKYLNQALADFNLKDVSGFLVDVGCGPVSILELLSGSTKWAFDPLHNGYESIRQSDRNGVEYKEGTGEQIPVADGQADYAFTTNSLDHMIDPAVVLKEFWRILKPSGFACIHVCVNNASEGHIHPAHAIDLTPEWLKQVCTEIGFELVSENDCHYGWRSQCAVALVFRKPNVVVMEDAPKKRGRKAKQ